MNVVLLRTPRPSASKDPYALGFLHSGYKPNHLSILSTSFINLNLLSTTISNGAKNYSGVIITSPRSMEAWSLTQTNQKEGISKDWENVPFFVVGPATKLAVQRIWPEKLNIFGENTGNGQELGEFIVAWFKENGGNTHLPILDLIGDKNRETIPNLLKLNGILWEKLQVYATGADPTFESRLDDLIEQIVSNGVKNEKKLIIWMVFFSPSGSKSALEILRTKSILSLPSKVSSIALNLDNLSLKSGIKIQVKFGVIGPTTKSYLEDDEGLDIEADADSPDPSRLLKAIEEADLKGN